MFTVDYTVDAVQNGKKELVKTFIQNESVAGAMNTFIDTESELTKKAVKTGLDTFTTLASETTKVVQNSMKFDYVKFNEGIIKAFTEAKK